MFEKYVDKIDAAIKAKGNVTTDLLREIISAHAVKKSDMLHKYERYKASLMGVPIYSRTLPAEANKINNKLANDYFSEIIDTKVGYMFGIPVINQLDKTMVGGSYDNITTALVRFKKLNSLDDMAAETCKFAGMCGYDAALAYIDKEGQERVMRVDPWEAIILSRTEYTDPEYAIRYFITWEDKMRVEFYTDKTRTTFQSTTADAGHLEFVDQVPHLFEYVPMWGVPNNAELQGDADKVLSLIDGYDRSMSDFNSEIEQFRLAYLLFFGCEPDPDAVELMRQTGALHIPNPEEGQKIEFLTKVMNHQAIDSHLDRLEANITRFAKHVNFTDEAFAGNLSGVAMKYKLFSLETKAKYFERKHDAALLHMFKVIASAWAKKGLAFDWTAVENKYTRNVAINIVDEANSAVALLGVVSRRTAISTLSFVNDPDEELEQIEREKTALGEDVDLDNEDGEDTNTDPNAPANKDGETGKPKQ